MTAAPPPPLTVLPGDFLAADAVLDHTHPDLRAAADSLRSPDGDTATAEATFLYVRDGIGHSRDVGAWSAAHTASEVLAAGNAICHGKAHLLAALLRANGIPAGLAYQSLGDGEPGRFVLHGLTAVHLDGRWVRLDPRGNRADVDARFSADPADERLAFPVDPALGETDYRTVHATVPPALLDALRRAVPGEPGFAWLPSRL